MATKGYDPLVSQLDKIRANRGMSVTVWAELSGVARMTIYRALSSNNKRSVSLNIVHLLADALGMRLTVATKSEPLD